MRLKNKKTGEIKEIQDIMSDMKDNHIVPTLFVIESEWEDYEEPKVHWYIYGAEPFEVDEGNWDKDYVDELRSIGNYFSSREEAEKAVERLRAWKRLKDKGFRFTLTPGVGSLDITPGKFQIEINADMSAKWFCCDGVQEDLDACFGGEE